MPVARKFTHDGAESYLRLVKYKVFTISTRLKKRGLFTIGGIIGCHLAGFYFSSVQSLSHLTLCNPMDCSTPGFPVYHQLLELTQTHVHRVSDAIQTSDPLSSPSPPAFNLSQHQGLFQWVSSSHQVAQALELQHQSFRGIFRTGMTHRFYSLWIGWKWKHQFFGAQLSL